MPVVYVCLSVRPRRTLFIMFATRIILRVAFYFLFFIFFPRSFSKVAFSHPSQSDFSTNSANRVGMVCLHVFPGARHRLGPLINITPCSKRQRFGNEGQDFHQNE